MYVPLCNTSVAMQCHTVTSQQALCLNPDQAHFGASSLQTLRYPLHSDHQTKGVGLHFLFIITRLPTCHGLHPKQNVKSRLVPEDLYANAYLCDTCLMPCSATISQHKKLCALHSVQVHFGGSTFQTMRYPFNLSALDYSLAMGFDPSTTFELTGL